MIDRETAVLEAHGYTIKCVVNGPPKPDVTHIAESTMVRHHVLCTCLSVLEVSEAVVANRMESFVSLTLFQAWEH